MIVALPGLFSYLFPTYYRIGNIYHSVLHARIINNCSNLLSDLYMNNLSPTVLWTSFRKSFFCLTLYTEEVNSQTFVMIKCKTICRKYLCTNNFILVVF